MNNEIEILKLMDKNGVVRQYLVVINQSAPQQEFNNAVSRYEISIYRICKNMHPVRHDGKFIAEYRSIRNEVDFAVNNINISGQSQGLHLGSYMLNKIVEWAMQWPDARIKPIHLASRDATGENKERRNRLYEGFGMAFTYSDEDRESGCSNSDLRVKDLQLVNSWKEHMEKKTIIDFIAQSYEDTMRLQDELKQKTNAFNAAVKQLDYANKNPIKFALIKYWVQLTWLSIPTLFVIYKLFF